MTDLEDLLALQIKASGLPEPEREVVFLQGRKFRADFCWKQQRVVAEVQGGTYQHYDKTIMSRIGKAVNHE